MNMCHVKCVDVLRRVPRGVSLPILLLALVSMTVAGCEMGERLPRPAPAKDEALPMMINGVPISIRPTADHHGMVDVDRFEDSWADDITITLSALDEEGTRAATWVTSQSSQGVRDGGWPLSRDDELPKSLAYDLIVDEARRMGREYVVLVASVDGDEVTRLRHQIPRNRR